MYRMLFLSVPSVSVSVYSFSAGSVRTLPAAASARSTPSEQLHSPRPSTVARGYGVPSGTRLQYLWCGRYCSRRP